MRTSYYKYLSAGDLFNIRKKHKLGNKLQIRDFTCVLPYASMIVDKFGKVYICGCHGFLPYPVGNILDFDSIEDIWSHPIAKKLQENTKAGSNFKFCQLSHCTPRYEHEWDGVCFFVVAIDDSCNLQCPSCRTSMIHYNSGPVYEERQLYMNKFLELLTNFERPTLIELGGDGEVFSSKIYSQAVYDYVPRKEHNFSIRSNATLINQKRLMNSKVIDQLQHFVISIDAGSEEVYNIVRPPGHWKKLIDNLDFLKENGYRFELSFVLQKSNLYDVMNWVNLCAKYGCLGVLTAVDDWSTWGDKFHEQQVYLDTHPLYNDWKKIYNEIKGHTYSSGIFFGSEEVLV